MLGDVDIQFSFDDGSEVVLTLDSSSLFATPDTAPVTLDPVTATPDPAPAPTPGTNIRREWKGVIHNVNVVPDGFVYEGRQFNSLSEIARAITGVRWNGPRFFGLRAAMTA